MRLVESLRTARIDAPTLKAGLALIAPHWRRMQVPWAPLSGDAARLATSFAIRTSETETPWVMPKSSGGVWAPSARIWNMSEGSFDQREAIFAPTPATIGFRVVVPQAARLSFSAAVASSVPTETRFTVSIATARGEETDACEVKIPPRQTDAWTDATCPLDKWAGQSVELRLKTSAPGGGPSPALWGNPTILARSPADLPYNVLWVVVDALRPDVIASFHDDAEDAKKRAAPREPLEALLPKIPGLTPVLDDLASKGVRFTHAYSGGAWTRPGTLAMLAGARSTELGIDPLPWVLPDAAVARYYASSPPLLPLILRRHGAVTRAFVNNYFMVGYAPVGVDMGFERVDDHRYRTLDTQEITKNAVDWIGAHGGERFFVFCNYNSPHEPWEPPKRFQDRVPPAPAGPKEWTPRQYMAEAAKDDEAIGALLKALDDAHVRDHTLIVVTADHGETLSSAHAGVSKLDNMQVRYHHAVSNYEETSRIPILLVLPGALPAGKAVTARVRNTDLAPTVLDLEGLERDPKASGRSMLPLVRGEKEADERVVVTEGRGTRAVLAGKYRLLVREGAAQVTKIKDEDVTVAEELYDLEADPGERHNLAHERPEVVAEMRARLLAAQKNVPAAGTAASLAAAEPGASDSSLHLRFAGAGAVHRVSGTVVVSGPAGAPAKAVAFEPVGAPREAFKLDGAKLDLALETSPAALVGLDLRVEPPTARVGWTLFLDDKPWPERHVFAGPFGLADASIDRGVVDDEGRAAVHSARLPFIDVARDLGLFVTRERAGESTAPERGGGGSEAAAEMNQLLKEWGYARASGGR